MQVCIKCNTVLPNSSFYKDKSRTGGRYTKCRTCVIEYERSRKQERSPVDHARMREHLGAKESVPPLDLITLWNEGTSLALPRVSDKDEPLIPL